MLKCANFMQITDIFASKCEKIRIGVFSQEEEIFDSNIMIQIQISRKSYKYFANIVQMIGMFSQEEDGVTIWGPARGRSPLPQQVAAIYLL